ncbi:eukaryotic translation initiation factor 4 gamma 1 isoform X1 [Parasteatoda tepidariorum]|uniref:eukaryotic translation initiation factor 4 gamma 1 isoform X1 n=1 Tax=Parasteatoda tepidariorum TaxID=114398 RepID=UPI0039BC382C
MSGIVNGSKVLDFTEDIKLHEAEEPWKPSFKLKRSSEANYGTSVEKKLKCNALSILNKITPEKFELLLKQLEKLDFKDEQASNVLICLIYEKAVREPIYNKTYVKMCKFLAPIKISSSNFIAMDFHSLFVRKCLKEFENALQDQRKFTDSLDSYDLEKLKEEMWEEQYKIKFRLLGNVKLLGELFNQNMLLESDVQNCLKRLCSEGGEVLLEALCLMLKTVGKKLLKCNNPVYISEREDIFQKMQNIVDKHLASTRIRFMILDVIDLKENNWILRREEIIPKTIKEIHSEALLEGGDNVQRNRISHSKQNNTDPVETRSKHLIEDFLENKDLEPVCQYVSSLLPNRVIDFINSSFCLVLEGNPQNRDSVGELIFQLVKKKFVKIDQFRDGFSGVVEKCKNLAVDTPLVWNNVGEIVYPLVKNDQKNLHILKILLEPHISSDTLEKVVSGVFHCIVAKEGSHKAKLLWDELKQELDEVISNRLNIDDILI